MKITDDLLKFRAEFSDVRSLADLPYLTPERLARYKRELAKLEEDELERK
jgi:hypothetical protein